MAEISLAGAQQPGYKSVLPFSTYRSVGALHFNKRVFQNMCPEALSLAGSRKLSYRDLVGISNPGHFRQPFQDVFYSYLCRQLRARRELDITMRKFPIETARVSPEQAVVKSVPSLAFKNLQLSHPYDKLKSDYQRLLNEEDGGWSFLGMLAVELARDIWVRNR